MGPSGTAVTKRLPNLVIVGVAKAGTTSLFEYLAQHPDICGAARKEARYFLHLWDDRPPVLSLEEYAALFDGCGQRRFRMEATPQYFLGGRRLIDAMLETLPDPHGIVCLRDPVERLWSVYWSQAYKRASLRNALKHGLDRDWDSFVRRCEAVHDRDEHELPVGEADWVAHRLVAAGRYAEHLGEWFDALDARFTVVFFDDLRENPQATTRRVFDWLGIAPQQPVDVTTRNPTVWPKSNRFHEAAQWVWRAADLRRRAPTLNAAAVRLYQRVNTTPGAPQRLDGRTRERLAALYADSNRRTAAILRDRGYDELPAWLSSAGAPVDASP